MDKLISLFNASNYSAKDVGGKVHSLSQLLKAGFNVPEGLVIPTRLQNREAEVKNALKEYFGSHSQIPKRYAVRSSAVNEDSKKMSFAGMMNSYLDVPEEEVLSSVCKVWKSLENVRLKEYYRALESKEKENHIAVIIQEYVDTDFSGVCFTRNPVTRANQIVVETVKGVGETLVQGNSTPKTIYVDRDLKLHASGETYIDTKIFKNAINIFLAIEKFFKTPMDIEFAIKKRELFILQARPITSL